MKTWQQFINDVKNEKENNPDKLEKKLDEIIASYEPKGIEPSLFAKLLALLKSWM